MLVYNIFWKPFLHKKQQFKFYFILIFLCVFLLSLILGFNASLNKILLNLNENENYKMIVVSKIKNSKAINTISSLKEVDKFYKLYDDISVDTTLGKMNITYKNLSEYFDTIIIGNSVEDCVNCMILPQYINLNNELINTTDYIGKKINLSYKDENDILCKVDVEVVGIYNGSDNSSIISMNTLPNLQKFIETNSYMLTTKKVEYVDVVLEKINNLSQSSVYDLTAYNQNKVLVLFASILKILFIIIIVGLLILGYTLINNIIFDMKDDIAIMRAYGFSNFLIIRNVFFIILLIFFGCFLISILLNYLLINLTFLKKYLTFLSFFENINMFLIYIFIILISSIISVFLLKKKTIYYLLKM